MIVQTFQPLSVYEEVMDCGIVYAEQSNSEKSFDLAYEWMKIQMIERGFLPNEKEKHMFWCWCWTGDFGKKNVDLRTKRYNYELSNNHVLMTLKKSEKEILCSDFELWHFALNYWHLSKTKEEEEFWSKLCEFKETNFYKNKPLNDFNLDRTIKDSWNLIFEIERKQNCFLYKELSKEIREHLEIGKTPVVTQGTFWNIKKEDVLKVKK